MVTQSMVSEQIRRLQDAYPAVYLACHRRHVRSDEGGRHVTEHQASILDHLDTKHPLTLSKLAEHAGVGLSAMSITVSRLERAGYVQRTKIAGDGRQVGLLLTRVGARIKEQNSVLDSGLVQQMFRLMRAGEIETALAGLETLAKYGRTLLKLRKGRRYR